MVDYPLPPAYLVAPRRFNTIHNGTSEALMWINSSSQGGQVRPQ
ncbi:hypothetical protein J2T07_000358 [Luteibacter jiangsuensis]|uniref:Uncharacterized protein n=1 Tax=Luteibacter jiangsuensis TaxID=637577 RepID=A0ABT9SUH6_9GAMM|nr:hypothetical protein [Luteibacter jiangsuensis]